MVPTYTEHFLRIGKTNREFSGCDSRVRPEQRDYQGGYCDSLWPGQVARGFSGELTLFTLQLAYECLVLWRVFVLKWALLAIVVLSEPSV